MLALNYHLCIMDVIKLVRLTPVLILPQRLHGANLILPVLQLSRQFSNILFIATFFSPRV